MGCAQNVFSCEGLSSSVEGLGGSAARAAALGGRRLVGADSVHSDPGVEPPGTPGNPKKGRHCRSLETNFGLSSMIYSMSKYETQKIPNRVQLSLRSRNKVEGAPLESSSFTLPSITEVDGQRRPFPSFSHAHLPHRQDHRHLLRFLYPSLLAETTSTAGEAPVAPR